jgi:hypothetical protein
MRQICQNTPDLHAFAILNSQVERAAASGPQAASGSAASGHPWRPFDRDKDLQRKPKGLDPAELLKKQAGLGSRFSSAGASRKM